MQLVVPQAGRTTYSVRGGPSFQVNAGREAFILRPGEYRSTSSQVASLVIQIDKHVVMELTEIAKQIDVTLTSENVRTLPLQHPRYKEPVNRLIKIFQSLSVDDNLNTGMRSAVIDFLLDVLIIERNHNRPNSRHPNVNSYEVFRKALSFVQANIDREISNHELCQTLDLTLSALFRLCHEGLGSTPQVWIQTLRLQRALELLKANPQGISLKLVAKKVGFKNLSEFRTFFFHQFGLMPEQVQIALKN
ncbi:MAG: AraC family transcriptional regulator [Oxalobacteraceae bacterium]|nr:AraC family transcriptional regulator [Oxalobacteraceae bacterium]